MRIRSIKPEFWRSERVAALPWDARFVLKGLESYVDDNGVGKDDIALIVSDVFPRDMLANPRETVARVSEAISLLHRAGFIHRYEANNTRLLYISWWDTIQRIDKPGKGRFPRPDGTMEYRESEIRESVANPPDTPLPVTEEQGNRGTGEDDPRAHDDEPDYGPVPEHIDNPTRPTPRPPTNAAKTVVRQTLGTTGLANYPRTFIDRLARQVENLTREGHPDTLIRQTLTEWDQRTDALPEWLPTILGDLVKNQRATPGNNGRPKHKMRGLAELAQQVQTEEQTQLAATQKELA